MSAERLREAAKVLRERAEAATPWPCEKWTYNAVRHIARNCDIECSHDEWDASLEEWVGGDCPSPDGGWDRYKTHEYIATMHPGVGLALADWLDCQADTTCDCGVDESALVLADLILEGTP